MPHVPELQPESSRPARGQVSRVPGGLRGSRLVALAAALFGAACLDARGLDVVVTGPPPLPADRPIEVVGGRYVSSDACRACHVREYETWHDSYHRTMTQVVTPETMLAPFDGRELRLREHVFRLERRGDGFWVEMDDPDWAREGPAPRVWREIVMSTGSHTFQAYWFASGASRMLSLFLFVYRIDSGNWVPMDAAFLAKPELHRTPDPGSWNRGCQQCHVTQGKPRMSGPHAMDTRATEFGIACEACHGPGREHVIANGDPVRRYGLHLGGAADGTIVDPTDLPARLASQACGQCHATAVFKDPAAQAQFNLRGHGYRPGDELTAQRVIVTEGEGQFWSDGMIRVSGREYNGLIRSPCYEHDGDDERVMTCYSCHQMHQAVDDRRGLDEWRNDQLKPGMEGDAACTQCHGEYASAERKAEHAHHDPAASAITCYDCHMPHTSWGLLKAIRAHEVSSPAVDAALATGRPTACNLCHLDRTLAWTAEQLAAWYGHDLPELGEDARATAASVDGLLSGDAGQRALVAWSMGWEPARAISGEDWMAPFLAQLLVDPYDAVRFRAFRSLRTLPGFGDLEYDFVGPEEQRETARLEVLARWRERGVDAGGGGRPAVLLDAAGRLDAERFERLLSVRDDRPLVLQE